MSNKELDYKFGFSFSDPLANFIYTNYAELIQNQNTDRSLSILDDNITITGLNKDEMINMLDSFSNIDLQFDGDDYILFKDSNIIKVSYSHRKEHYDLDFTVFSINVKEGNAITHRFKKHFENHVSNLFGFSIDWKYKGGEYSTTEYVDDVVYPEAYPNIHNLDKFVSDYLDSKEPVLILRGIAGSGKTRLIRMILKEMCRKNIEHESYKTPSVLYTMDDQLLNDDGFFVEFLNSRYNILVLEDLDNFLESRTEGNRSMSKLLTVSDGVVQTIDKKIIISTNLHNIGDFDEALLRAGRCFANVKFRKLSWSESERFIKRINPDIDLSSIDQTDYSLAQLYEIISEKDVSAEVTDERSNRAGF